MRVRHFLAVAAIVFVGMAGFDVTLHSRIIREGRPAGSPASSPISPLVFGDN